MITRNWRAPDYASFRSFREPQSDHFPIFKGLVDAFVDATEHPSPKHPEIAYTLATLSTYAYSDESTVADMAARLGLRRNHCRLAAVEVDVLFVRSRAYLVQSEDGRVVVLVYRGTSPTSAINWLGDLDVDPEKLDVKLDGHSGDFQVHRGFYRNVRATGSEVMAALKRAIDGRSVDLDDDGNASTMPGPMEALYITGHSLGGAMAELAAVLIKSDEEFAELAAKIRGVYTYGGPMVCNAALADLCDQDNVLGGRVVRYVYSNDAVPQLPPKASGPFKHFGTELHYDADERHPKWKLRKSTKQMRTILWLAELAPSFLARQLEVFRHVPFHASLSDHLPQHYIDALTPEGKGIRTEFGD